MGALIIDKVLRSRDNYAVSREDIPCGRGRALIVGDRAEKSIVSVSVLCAVRVSNGGDVPQRVILERSLPPVGAVDGNYIAVEVVLEPGGLAVGGDKG